MKCICGYEKIGFQNVVIPAKEVLYSTGKRRGQIKKIEPEHLDWREVDPEKEDFYKIEVEKGFVFNRKRGEGWRESVVETALHACPKCGTIKIDI